MKRILLIALLIQTCHTAHAQTFGTTLGGRLELVPFISSVDASLSFVLMLGVDFGVEVRYAPITVGARVTLSSLILVFLHGQADLYVGYMLPEGLMLYAGAGYSTKANIFGGINDDIHALLGLRFPDGMWLEVTSGIGFTTICADNPSQPRLGCSSYKNAQGFVIGAHFGITLIF